YRLKQEIVAVPIPQKNGDPLLFSQDDHPRPDTTLEALSNLKPVVKPNGTITAGNASGVNDGACALLLASEGALKRYKLTPRARGVAAAAARVAPRVAWMGPGRAPTYGIAEVGVALGHVHVSGVIAAY